MATCTSHNNGYSQGVKSVTANQKTSAHLTSIKKLYISDFYSYGKFRDRGQIVILARKLHRLDIYQQAAEFKSKGYSVLYEDKDIPLYILKKP